jgi:hypothetical protein
MARARHGICILNLHSVAEVGGHYAHEDSQIHITYESPNQGGPMQRCVAKLKE